MSNLSLVVLAAGKGTRFLPLTKSTPKPLLPVANLPVLARSLSSIAPKFSQIILVVGYMGEKIQEYFGSSLNGTPIVYVKQAEPKGTGDAMYSAKDLIEEDFILLHGDDLYEDQVFEKFLSLDGLVVGGKKVKNWQHFGILKTNPEGNLEKIVEKPTEFIGDLASIGIFKLSKEIFETRERITESSRGELDFTDMLSLFAQENPVKVIEVSSGWIPLSYPWDLLTASEFVLESLKSVNQGKIEEGATIHGKVTLGENSVIKAGAYIEGNFIIGKNCVIGPNCYLKGFGAIGDDSYIGNGVEICRSILGKGVNVRHLSYIGDSILGNGINIAAGTITANLTHQMDNVKVMINGQLVDSNRQKFGTIIGDNSKTGINTSIYPGRKIDTNSWTLPNEVVKEDKSSA